MQIHYQLAYGFFRTEPFAESHTIAYDGDDKAGPKGKNVCVVDVGRDGRHETTHLNFVVRTPLRYQSIFSESLDFLNVSIVPIVPVF